MRAPRWPFVAAPATLLAGVAVWQVAPSIAQSYRDHKAQHAEAMLEAQIRPATAALDELHLPDVTPCWPGRITAGGLICAKGTSAPVPTATALRDALKRSGAGEVVASCVSEKSGGPLCRVSARVAGSPVAIGIAHRHLGNTAADRASGSFLAGGIGDMADTAIMPRGAPLPLPA